ncbi:MAG: RusA family crossover junction endodeoxyribonuclease, partial [Streptosporangiaceae bacterium]|nr:RusA family crossover junction endodeoxyribonuclease [Streptosporangiaceae bacterium]
KFRATAPGHKPNSEHTYGVTALFVSGTRHRRDVDNMLKLILDGLNKVAWADDDQVVEVSGRKTYEPLSRDHARTEVVVYRTPARETPMSNRSDLLQAAQVTTFFPAATDEQVAAFLTRFELRERA